MKEEFKSSVYTQRPPYADFCAPKKFQAIESIVAKRLREHPNAICSYSGGADSDIMIDLIERVRTIFNLPPVKYVFFNTGLEMAATKRHVKEVAEKYNVEIETKRPKTNIVNAVRKHGVPFVSKIMSAGLNGWQKKKIPLDIHDEYWNADDKQAKYAELVERYPGCKTTIKFICCCNGKGEPRPDIQLAINSSKYMLDFIREYPPEMPISADCCTYCKKNLAHDIQKGYEMVITGERRDEGGMRSVPRADSSNMCFAETSDGQYRLRPLYYVSDKDKAWYKEYYNVKYSDAYEVYGLTRTGCCGCPISYKAVDDLKLIEPYEPNIVKAAWNIFGRSYEYRKLYNEYKKMRMEKEKEEKEQIQGQLSIFDWMPEAAPGTKTKNPEPKKEPDPDHGSIIVRYGAGTYGWQRRIKQAYDKGELTPKFMANEYGVGGMSLTDPGYWFMQYDAKGIRITLETREEIKFTWKQVTDLYKKYYGG